MLFKFYKYHNEKKKKKERKDYVIYVSKCNLCMHFVLNIFIVNNHLPFFFPPKYNHLPISYFKNNISSPYVSRKKERKKSKNTLPHHFYFNIIIDILLPTQNYNFSFPIYSTYSTQKLVKQNIQRLEVSSISVFQN